ncbi:hypothetical protein V1478_016645, partial [Vespula squamosa]
MIKRTVESGIRGVSITNGTFASREIHSVKAATATGGARELSREREGEKKQMEKDLKLALYRVKKRIACMGSREFSALWRELILGGQRVESTATKYTPFSSLSTVLLGLHLKTLKVLAKRKVRKEESTEERRERRRKKKGKRKSTKEVFTSLAAELGTARFPPTRTPLLIKRNKVLSSLRWESRTMYLNVFASGISRERVQFHKGNVEHWLVDIAFHGLFATAAF